MPFDVDAVRRAFPGRAIAHFERVGSTMIEAQGAPAGSVFVADEQTAGQGRHGHSWHSEPESGLYVSMALEAPADPVLTLALGLAAAEAIARETDLRCDLRWPNDVLIGEKKVAGILVQLAGAAAIAGIGINVNHANFPPELADRATSLAIETGRRYRREDLLIALISAVESFRAMLLKGGKQAILRLFEQTSSYAKGKRVTVRGEDGVTDGLDENGFLRLRKDDGAVELILAGGVRTKGQS